MATDKDPLIKDEKEEKPDYIPRLSLQSYRSPTLPKWYKNENNQNANPYSSMGGTGNCVWYAFGRFSEVRDGWADHGVFNGDAGNWWYSNKSAKRYSYGQTPQLGAVACWGKTNGAKDWGHVAIVEEVISPTKFKTSESGYQSYWFRSFTRNTTDRITGGGGTYKFLGFIYNPGSGDYQLGLFEDEYGDEELYGINSITDIPYGEEIATEMSKHLGESGSTGNDGNWGVTLLYSVFDSIGIADTCFNMRAYGSKKHWSYQDAYDWLMRNGTFIYDYTEEKVKMVDTTPGNKDKAWIEDEREYNWDKVGTDKYEVNTMDDFQLSDIGDIVFLSHGNNDYTSFDGIGVICEETRNSTITFIGEYLGKVVKQSRHRSTVHTIIRPPYGVIFGGIRTPEQADILSTSDNYESVFSDYDNIINDIYAKKDSEVRSIAETVKTSGGPDSIIPDSEQYVGIISSGNIGNKDRLPETVFEGDFESKTTLPTPITPIEAPFISVNIAGVEIGTYRGRSAPPNYISGLVVRRTNSSLNEYTLNLIHQVSPGDNPNYIDELLGVNGYNEIIITYGDAEGGITYMSVKALITDVHTSFDFINCNINYVISATSSAALSATYRTNFSGVYNKPSTVIREIISSDPSIKSTFPLMSNLTFVDSNNLIPNTDAAVSIPAYDNITPLNYIREITSYMTNNLRKSKTELSNSVYVFYIDDNINGSYFKINEINTANNISNMVIAYEVDVGYPDTSQVFDFKVDTDYAWAMSYNYNDGIRNYEYDLDDVGNIVSTSKTTLTSNWWTKMTEMPITAQLTVRGLISPMMLMTYVKVNCSYYGSQRISSGVYVVIGQTDTLDKNGFRSTLNLLRVAGANQYLNIDGRVET